MEVKKLFIRDKNFYKKLLTIAIPITLQSLITFAINMMDTVMVGSLGEVPLSASSLSGQIFFITTVLCFGIAGGGSVLSSQFWGKKDSRSIAKTLSIVLKLNIIVGIIFSILSFFIPGHLLGFYINVPEVIQVGIPYLKIVSIMYPLFCITTSISVIFRTISQIKISVIANSIAFVLNVFFNWVFIFGKFGFPSLGLTGAAIGTIIARLVECIIMVTYLFFVDKKIQFTFKDLIEFDKDIFKKYLKTGINVLISDALLVAGLTTLTMILGRLGEEMIAANSICNIVIQLSTISMAGISSSCLVIIGNSIGEGKVELAKNQAKTFLIICIITGIISAIIITLTKPFAIDFYNVSQSTKSIAYKLMDGAAFVIIFQVPSICLTKGILRGGGDTKFLLLADIIFLWILSIPLGILAAFVFHLSPAFIYICLKFDEIIKFIWCSIRMFGNKWVKDVTVS